MKKKLSAFAALFLLTAALFCGCAGKASATLPDCPFSEMKWADSVKDMEKLEGSGYDTYDSVYGGTTYTYDKSYLEKDGTVKYMFDDKENLAGIAWAFSSDDETELLAVYEQIHETLVNAYGDSGYNTSKETNYGDVWYREEGNIIISTMLTEEQKALQFAFVSPEQSTAEEDTHQSDAPDLIQ